MRNQLMLSAAVAMAAATDAGNDQGGQTQEQAKKLEPFTLTDIRSSNVKKVATEIWARIKAKNKEGKPSDSHGDKSDVLQELITALREVRDNDDNKTTRPKKSVEEIIKESVGKPMGELQAAKVNILGMSINFPTMIKIATSVAKEGEAEHPLKSDVVAFMKEHKLTVQQKKTAGSRGRTVTFLVEATEETGDIDKLDA